MKKKVLSSTVFETLFFLNFKRKITNVAKYWKYNTEIEHLKKIKICEASNYRKKTKNAENICFSEIEIF